MQSLLILLLITLVNCDVKFSIDSEDTADSSTFNGMVVLVTSDENDEPEIVMSSNLDGYTNVFCLALEEMFEATSYVTTNGDENYGNYDEESNSEVDFQGDVNWEYLRGTDGKSFILTGTMKSHAYNHTSPFDSMEFSFAVQTATDDATAYGLKYSFQLNGYEWISTDPTAKLVLVLELKACDDEFESNDFSNDDSVSNDDDDTTVAPESRRRLKDTTQEPVDDDSGDEESDDGISSDDSEELDIGISRFINTPIAYCMENGTVSDTQIATNLVYGEAISSGKIHIVFEHFDCDLFQDPWWGNDDTKRSTSTTDHAIKRGIIYSVMIGFALLTVLL